MPKYIPKRIRPDSAEVPFQLKKPELMSPAGDWECVRAAVENGADAVYFGLDRFNARMRANNFTIEDLPELMAFLHHRGVKGYLTFNTLVFTGELHEAMQFLKSVIAAGVDAAIVQDVGICRLIRQMSPDFPIHASTQLSVSSEAGLLFAKELGASRTVVARECSLEEIAAMREQTAGTDIDMPVEIFVHGALCVAYSGQCLTSESLGGRSANRGECAQACRLPYELYADGEKIELGDRRYLLSPQDLSGIDLLPEIIRAGVETLKIEGRLKTPEYVAAVTQVYRKAIDDAWLSITQETKQSSVDSQDRYKLEMTFSRGLDTGWMEGIDNQRLVHARFGKKRGVKVGTVERVTRSEVWIRALPVEIKAGDGVVFDAGNPDVREEGGRIMTMHRDGNAAALRFLDGAVDFNRIRSGQTVWKTSDPILERELRKSFEVEQPTQHRPIDIQVSGSVGKPLTLEIQDEEGRRIEVCSDQPLIEAENRPLDETVLRKQLGRLGQTPYALRDLRIDLEGSCMFPMSALNQLRRDAVDALDKLRKAPRGWELNRLFDIPLEKIEHSRAGTTPYLIPYLRNEEQLDAVIALPYREVYLELENPAHYKRVVEHFREVTNGSGRTLWVAPPRMFKPGEDWITDKLLNCGPDGFLVRNHEHLRALQGHRLRGDFSLNVANPLTADWLIERWNLERLTASYDLNNLQLTDLLRYSPTDRFEITLHQHMPMFHMEHCLFCAFLTKGKDFRDCGRPCDTRQVTLKDRMEMQHPVKVDAGCRNTVFNAKAQTGADYVHEFIAAGVNAFRIEFLNESAEEVTRTLDRYERLLRMEISGKELWKELKLINQLGVTRGTLRDRS